MRRLVALIGLSLLFVSLGNAQTTHGILFNWTQSTSTGVTANRVKCGTATGGPYSIVFTSTGPIVSYDWLTTSSIVGVGGTRYYCVVTALAGTVESVNSNEVNAIFPETPPTPVTGATATAH